MKKMFILILTTIIVLLCSCKKVEEIPEVNDVIEEEIRDYSEYVGIWESETYSQDGFGKTELKIKEVDKQYITFAVTVISPSGRIASTNDVTAIIENSQTEFVFYDDFENVGGNFNI